VRLRIQQFALFAASFLFLLALVEALLRIGASEDFHVWPPHFQRTFRVEHIDGVSIPSALTINAQGMRGDLLNPSARYRLLAVGGSTTISVYLDDSVAWPYQLQTRLNAKLGAGATWVGNVGRPGHTTTQHLLQVEKLLAQHPQIDAVLLLIGANDLLIPLGWGIAPPSKKPDTSTHARLRAAFSDFPGQDADAPWYLRNAVGRLWRLRSWLPVTQLPVMDEAASFMQRVRRHRERSGRLLPAMPDLSDFLADYVRRVNQIIDIVERAGVRPILLTQPVLWRPGLTEEEHKLLWMGGPAIDRLSDGADYYSVEALMAGMQAYNDALLGVCRARGVECVDLASALPKTTRVFYDDAHFTNHGATRVAEHLARYLLARDPLDAP
jgi:lysophospholipase L1-like esterase